MDTARPLVPPNGADPTIRVLCVDDNRDAADSEALLLRIVGYSARSCYDGPSALTVADAFRPCICLVDLNMPGMDGDELAHRLRDRAAGRPLVLVAVTAMGSAEARERTAEFDRHLVKPVDPTRLLAEVEALGEKCHPGIGP